MRYFLEAHGNVKNSQDLPDIILNNFAFIEHFPPGPPVKDIEGQRPKIRVRFCEFLVETSESRNSDRNHNKNKQKMRRENRKNL